MCGIAGYLVKSRTDERILKKMVDSLYHRGPDSDGYYRSKEFHMGIRRLKINDLETGDQPLFNENGNIVLFYNGEIYNSPELREFLKKEGHRFKTGSDGEVICHLYEIYGTELFEKLDGMFSVALWIEDERKLILARDIPGEKPLYFSLLSQNEIIFASEIKAMLEFPLPDLSLNFQSIWDFPTFLWIPEPDTVFKGIKALMPGHIMIIDDKGIKIEAYKNCFNKKQINLKDEDIIEETRDVVIEAVHSRLLSDVPIGCFLSSGLDSSIVASLAAEKVDKISTFTIGFEDIEDPYHGRTDESAYAKKLAFLLGTSHHTIKVTADTFLKNLKIFCKYGDQPFGVSSGLGILSIAQAASQAGIKVLLSGDGADECFGGYSWYNYLEPVLNSSGVKNEESEISFQSFGLPLKERLEVLNHYTPQRRAWAWHYYASERDKSSLFSPELFDGVKSSLRFFYEYNDDKEWVCEDFIRQDRMFYLPNEMLRKVDRMTMAFSVEGRVPFTSPALLSHGEKLEYRHLVRDGILKWALREAFRERLPADVIERPKHGFNVPVDYWLKNCWSHLMEETFSSGSWLYRHGIIHKDSLAAARNLLNDPLKLHGHTIFTYIMLNIWFDTFLNR